MRFSGRLQCEALLKNWILCVFLLVGVGGSLTAKGTTDGQSSTDGRVSADVSWWRWPQGAVPVGTKVHFVVRTLRNDVSRVVFTLRDGTVPASVSPAAVKMSSTEHDMTLAAVTQDERHDVWLFEKIWDAPSWSSFTLYAEDSSTRRLVGEGRVSVFRADFRTPEWMKNGVVYQIFPDRFRNGQPENDGHGLQTLTFFDGALNKSVEMPQTNGGVPVLHAQWSDPVVAWAETKGECRYVDGMRFFGGDLRGIIEKIDYIASLGVTIIYLNPVFPSPSTHRYDPVSFHGVDPRLGTVADFTELTAQARKRGIRVVLDVTPDHTSDESLYFDAGKSFATVGAAEEKNSPYFPWYTFEEWPNKWKAWWGFSGMPTIDVTNPEYQRFFFEGPQSVLKYWNDLGAAGWRVDVAPEIPLDFARRFRSELKKLNPDGLLMAEVWNNPAEVIPMLLGDSYDSAMNYRVRALLLNNWDKDHSGEKPENQGFFVRKDAVADDVWKTYEEIRRDYAPEAFSALMNLVSSHDAARPLFYLEQTWDKLAPAALQAMAFFLYTTPGAPHVFAGDEIGMNHAGEYGCKKDRGLSDDPFMRRPFAWGKENEKVLAWYRQLGALRASAKVLRTGEMLPLQTKGRTLAWLRFDSDTTYVALVNGSDQPATVVLDVGEHFGSNAVLGGVVGAGARVVDGRLGLVLEPFAARLLRWGEAPFSHRPFAVKGGWQEGAVLLEFAGQARVMRVNRLTGDVREFLVEESLIDKDVLPGHPFLYKVASINGGVQVAHGEFELVIPGERAPMQRMIDSFSAQDEAVPVRFSFTDPAGDDRGPGSYTYPIDPVFRPGDFDLLGFSLTGEGKYYQAVFRMAHLDNPWSSTVGLSKLALWLFVDGNPNEGSKDAPKGLNIDFAEGILWDRAFHIEGWESRVFRVDSGEIAEFSARDEGLRVSTQISAGVHEVVVAIPAKVMGQLGGDSRIVVLVSGQDGYGVGRLRQVQKVAAPWHFGGGATETPPAVLDMLWPTAEGQYKLLGDGKVGAVVLKTTFGE